MKLSVAVKIEGGLSFALSALRTIALFAGVFCVWRAFTLFWELRPVWRKKYPTVVEAQVTEVTEEQRSASQNSYYIPRFEYEENGEMKAFSPKNAVRNCRLKVGERVKLCIGKKGKFRAVRNVVTPAKAAVWLAVGLVLVLTQIFI